MKNWIYGFVGVAWVGGFAAANGESFLAPATFPKTFNDAPFVARLQVLADDYQYYETVYDSDGRCISGCAYPGITIEEETAAIQRNTQMANMAAAQYDYSNTHTNYVANTNGAINTINPINSENSNTVVGTQNIPSVQNGQTAPSAPTYNCATHRIAQNTKIPANSPIDVDIIITSDFGPRIRPTAGASSVHRGIDISVPVGTPVYATADGTIEKIKEDGNKGGGKYIVIRHDGTNFRTSYMHLSNNNVLKVGDVVQAGCLVGFSGNTGASTGAHLDYRIFYTSGGKQFNMTTDMVDPLWTENRLATNYRFKNQSDKSCLHTAHNFCGTGTVPPDRLPGEIK